MTPPANGSGSTANESSTIADLPSVAITAANLPSGAMTARFLTLCDAYGAERLAVSIVRAGRTAGVAGLPATDDWAEWNAKQMRAAVEYLERKRGLR